MFFFVLLLSSTSSVLQANWVKKGDKLFIKVGGNGWAISKNDFKPYLWENGLWVHKYGNKQKDWMFGDISEGFAIGKSGSGLKNGMVYKWNSNSKKWEEHISKGQESWQFKKIGNDWAIRKSTGYDNNRAYQWKYFLGKWQWERLNGSQAFKSIGDGWAIGKTDNKPYSWEEGKWNHKYGEGQSGWEFSKISENWVIASGGGAKSGAVYYWYASPHKKWGIVLGDAQKKWTFKDVGNGWAIGGGGGAEPEKIYRWE